MDELNKGTGLINSIQETDVNILNHDRCQDNQPWYMPR